MTRKLLGRLLEGITNNLQKSEKIILQSENWTFYRIKEATYLNLIAKILKFLSTIKHGFLRQTISNPLLSRSLAAIMIYQVNKMKWL